MSNDLALANAIASVEMEGLYLSDEGYEVMKVMNCVANIPIMKSHGMNF